MKDAPKHYYRDIDLGFLPYTVHVCTGMTTDEMKAHIEKELGCENLGCLNESENPTLEGQALHIVGTPHLIIWLKSHPTSPATISNLSHEALHIVAQICSDSGIAFAHQNDETLCYILGGIVKPVLKDWFAFRIFGLKKRLAKGKKLGTLNSRDK